MRFPKITFFVTEHEEDPVVVKELQEYKTKFEVEWKRIENEVLKTFEEVTGRKWNETERNENIDVVFSAKVVPHAFPDVVLRIRDFSSWLPTKGEIIDHRLQLGVLIHELCHRFEDKNEVNYWSEKYQSLIDKGNLKDDPRITKGVMDMDNLVRVVCLHIHTEILWKSIVKKVFDEDLVNNMEKRERRLAPLYIEAFRIIDTLSEEEKKKIANYKL